MVGCFAGGGVFAQISALGVWYNMIFGGFLGDWLFMFRGGAFWVGLLWFCGFLGLGVLLLIVVCGLLLRSWCVVLMAACFVGVVDLVFSLVFWFSWGCIIQGLPN